MDSSSTDPTGFIPIDLTTDVLPDLTAGDPATRQAFLQSAGSGATGGIGSTFENLTVAGLITLLIGTIIEVVGETGLQKPVDWLGAIGNWIGDADHIITFKPGDSILALAEKISDTALIQPLLEQVLGLDTSKLTKQESMALKAVDKVIGFAITLEFGVMVVEKVGGVLLGNRWKSVVAETIGRLPELAGLNWALGLVINQLYEAAFGEALPNAIRRHARPNEPDWRIARTMLKQHLLTDDDLTTIMENAGYTPEWIDKLKKLEDQPMPVGDIQTAYQQGLITEGDIDTWLVPLGFSDPVREMIKQIYITKAMTSSGAEIATVYKTLFRNSEVTEQEYVDKLHEIHYPDLLIKDDVAAITKEKEVGWRLQSTAVIKSDYLHNPGDTTTAVTRLQRLGYSRDDALSLVNSWTAPPIPKHHGLSEAQILRYYVSGVLTRDQAQPQLQALGLDAGVVTFLLDNPTIVPKVRPQKLTPALVTAAYTAGALNPSDLDAKLREAGATDQTLPYLHAKAEYAYTHRHVAGSGVQPLTEGDIKEAFKYGLMSQQDAQIDLEGLGYSPANALILLEIVNKGEFQPPQPPYFPNVAAAISYLEAIGVTVKPGTDPAYDSALGLIIQAGYTYTAPPGFNPPEAPLPVPPPIGVIAPPPTQPPPTSLPGPTLPPPPTTPL